MGTPRRTPQATETVLLSSEHPGPRTLDPAELVALARSIPLSEGGTTEKFDAYVQANSTFHEQTIASSGHPALVDAYRRLSPPGIMAQVQTTHDTDSHAIVDDDLQIPEARLARDLATVETLIEAHHKRGGDVHPRASEGAGGRR